MDKIIETARKQSTGVKVAIITVGLAAAAFGVAGFTKPKTAIEGE